MSMTDNVILLYIWCSQEKNYVPFDFKKEEPFFAFQRKVLPNSMWAICQFIYFILESVYVD